ncbi:hypothetical protein EAH_00067930 [Eimeria acervulina]|uniref:Uncharacterized protein n=1 Tax=Eimeria acervulina TaxID=5801 RepID=U6GUE9_EIMAC|nr:hypothetical protein EAH_00067930 [Eimeria acervulina]CDI82923.1 hypothetical protein EAH_00067930 [Eimeria acervulina]
MRRICVLKTALDLAAAPLCIESGVSGKLNGGWVAFSVYCDAASADECKMRRICVLSTALDLAAATLWNEKGLKWYVGRWLEGFEWTIFVGVDMLAYIGEGLLMLEEGQRLWSADEWKMRRVCVLNTALDLAAAALWNEWEMGGKLNGGFLALSVYCHAAGADEGKERRLCVLKTALDLAGASLCV